jgi:hypothetical protein
MVCILFPRDKNSQTAYPVTGTHLVSFYESFGLRINDIINILQADLKMHTMPRLPKR